MGECCDLLNQVIRKKEEKGNKKGKQVRHYFCCLEDLHLEGWRGSEMLINYHSLSCRSWGDFFKNKTVFDPHRHRI